MCEFTFVALSHIFQVMSILKYLFPVPKDDSRRIMTFSNDDDFISFRLVHILVNYFEIS